MMSARMRILKVDVNRTVYSHIALLQFSVLWPADLGKRDKNKMEDSSKKPV